VGAQRISTEIKLLSMPSKQKPRWCLPTMNLTI